MTFADVTDQDHVKTTLQNQVRTGHVSHAYVFTGPRGVGKTTIARLFAKVVNCQDAKNSEPCNACQACVEITNGSALDVYEIDAASHTDVENVRENIVRSVRFAPNRLKYKVYIIDEVHMLSGHSFNALLKTLEEPPAHALFILATTDIHKVPPTVLSRCQRFDFRRIPSSSMVVRLKRIADAEGREIEEGVLYEIAKHAEGCARDAEGLLGQMFAIADGPITTVEASLVLPSTTLVLVVDFVESILKRDAEKCVRLLNAYVEQGVDVPHFTDEVIELLRSLLIAKIGGAERMADVGDAETRARLSEAVLTADAEFLSNAIRIFLDSKRGGKTDRIPQLGLELASVDVCLGKERQEGKDVIASASDTILSMSLRAPGHQTGRSNPTSEITPSTIFPVQEVVFNSVPVIGLEEVKAKWPEVFQQIKENNAALPMIIQAGEISGVDGDVVEFAFQYALHAETVNQDKNRCLIEGILEKVLGKKIRVRAKYVHAETDAAVVDLLQQFGGQAAG